MSVNDANGEHPVAPGVLYAIHKYVYRKKCFVLITAATAVLLLKVSPIPRLPQLPRFYRGNQC